MPEPVHLDRPFLHKINGRNSTATPAEKEENKSLFLSLFGQATVALKW